MDDSQAKLPRRELGEKATLMSFAEESSAPMSYTSSRPEQDIKDYREAVAICLSDRKVKKDRFLLQDWWLEILNSLLATGCVAAIVVVLFLHDRQPLPDWPAIISINSLVSIFTAVFKASLIMPVAQGIGQLKWDWFRRPQTMSDVVLFDEASRGPSGSMLLIMKQLLHPHKAYLAGLGALITIASLGIDPISQSMIEHKGCTAISNSSMRHVAEVARKNAYTAGRRWHSAAGVPSSAMHPLMEAAIYKGLSDPRDISALIDVRCSTGNCTFSTPSGGNFFSSLAMCYSSQNITNQIEQIDEPDSGWRTWQLPGPKGPQVFSTSSSEKLSIVSTPTEEAGDAFLSYDILMVTCPETGNNCLTTNSPDLTAIAVRFRLDPCVKTYRGKVVEGVYSETEDANQNHLLKRCYTEPYDGSDETGWFLTTNTTLVDGEEKQCIASPDKSPHLYPVSLSTCRDPSNPHSAVDNTILYYPRECIWVMDGWTTDSAIIAINGLILKNVVSSVAPTIEYVEGQMWLKEVYSDGRGNFSTIDKMAKGLASSMTAAIRNNPAGFYNDPSFFNVTVANGIVTTVQTCVYVHWNRIVYPVALLGMEWLFLTIVLTKQWSGKLSGGRGRLQSGWKSSPLPLLFHGLDEDLRNRNADLNSVQDMETTAGGTKVQLRYTGTSEAQGWRFFKD